MKKVAIAGLGGYAAQHHRSFENLEAAGVCRVIATCDPTLTSDRVPTYQTLEELLQRHGAELDLVTLPVPVPLHASMHRAVVDAGIACYLEKPPTLWWPELEAMLEVEAQAVRPSQVGFNFIGDSFRQTIKARILAGEFGPLLRVSFLGVWPRDADYYGRAGWAGKLRLDGRPVMDNPLGNAMAHYVQNLLFFSDAERLLEVRGRLSRAHPIESFDTAMIQAKLATGVELRLAATHASRRWAQRETIELERAKIVFPDWNRAEIHTKDGIEHCRSTSPDQQVLLQENLARYLEGIAPTPLSRCRPFVSLIDLAYLSAGAIETFAENRVNRREGSVDVYGLDEELESFVEEGIWPGPLPRTALANELNGLPPVP